MVVRFDPGYHRRAATLVRDYPGEDVYPADSFRTEWVRSSIAAGSMARPVC